MNPTERITSKICSWDNAETITRQWSKDGKRIVFSNGCFDLVHKGHVDYLARAATFGDKLVIGLNSDVSVQQLKGKQRPLVDEKNRAFVMAALEFVDMVVLFEEDTPYELIKLLQPDVLVKGKDYKPENIAGFDIVTAKGGEVKTVELVDGFSTTALIEKIKKAF